MKVRKVNPEIYTRDIYLNKCLGSDEFKKTKGKKLHWRVREMLSEIKIQSEDKILDLGCGRGDISLFLANKCRHVIGIDYSKYAIKIAKEIKKTSSQRIQRKCLFYQMDATNLKFRDNSFDKVIAIDIFEHLYPEELLVAMSEIKRVLKPNGTLFIHVGTNKYLYDITYKYFTRPLNFAISKIDRVLRHKNYDPLPQDPRTIEEKEQHVNEPTYFYLKSLLKKFNFDGKIKGDVGYIKEKRALSSHVYNF